MKFCQSHWDALRDAISRRGLSGFVAKNGAEAAKMMAEELRGGQNSDAPYDPLMRAHWAITGRALEIGGIDLLNGDICPLCELDKHTPVKASEWIEPCSDSILADFREHRWIAEAS